jgi:mRNA interferase RelE/StbE
VTYRIVWEPAAIDRSVRFLKDDPVGLAAVLHAVDALADDPTPPEAVSYGDFWRLRVGRYRVLYLITDEDVIVLVTNLGRTRD